MTDIKTLLAEYARAGSEPAFRELVARYIGLVHSTALRLVGGDSHLAEDVTQIVFVALAHQAPSLPSNVMLGGWLHRHTCFVAAKTVRGERRRETRERQAAQMNAEQDHSEANLVRIAPVLDEAINQLGVEDRTAILLRFFEQRDFRSVGDALGSNEDAARKRVGRALDKLHALLEHRGVTLSTAALGTLLGMEAVTAAPAGLAASVSGMALASTAAATTTTITLLKIMTMTKLKLGIISALVVAGAATPIFLQWRENANLRSHLASLEATQQQTEQAEESRQADREELIPLRKEHEESLRLHGKAAALLQGKPATVKSNTGAPKAARSTETPSIPLLPAANWANVGTATPADALQTLFWASAKQDTNALVKSLVWDPAAKAKLDALFAAAPESLRQQFGSVEALIYQMALGGHDTPMTGFGVVSVANQGDDATLVEEHQYQDGSVRQNTIQLHKEEDGWRILLDEKRLEKLGAYLASLTSQKQR